jgi:hypothetical protein
LAINWKPFENLLITGRFDPGKTRIANALLGRDNLPSQYTPTTSVVTFVPHVSDRPHWQKEDVWIMKKGFDPGRWNDCGHCQEFRLIAGGYESLRRFGTKESEGEEIGADDFLLAPASREASGQTDNNEDWIGSLPESVNLREILEQIEMTLITRALQSADGVQAEAARRLGLSRSDLNYKLTKYGIKAESPG